MKKLLKRLAPNLFQTLKTLRRRREFRHAHGGSEYRAKVALVRAYGLKVITGPFAGMAYGDDVLCSAYVAKLVGSYEEELHDIIEMVRMRQPAIVVDIGCAEGYYAVGLARLLPNAEIFAYDISLDGQRFCSDLAHRNGVSERVHVGGICDHAVLQHLTQTSAFILCDCEGCEFDLLDPGRVPGLAHSTLLIELHDFLSPGLTPCLTARFQNTHEVTLIDTRERDPSKYTVLATVADADRYYAVREGREAAMQWAYLTPKIG